MEVVAFLAMIILLLLILSHCKCHLLEDSLITTEKATNDEPKMTLIQAGNYSISSHIMPLLSLLLNAIPIFLDQLRSQKREEITPKIPIEFEGRNPCVDWILVRLKYPGSDCHFYQCELHQPVKPACRLQVIDEPFPIIDSKTVIEKNILVRINSCLSIRIFKCAYGYKYSDENKGCVKFLNNYSKFICPS